MAHSHIPLIGDESGIILCKGLPSSDDTVEFRVPVTNQLADPPAESDFERLKAIAGDLAEDHDFLRFYREHNGARLLVSPPPYEHDSEQNKLGCVYIASIEELSEIRGELEDWFFDGPEVEFEDMGYGWDDIIPFGMRNWSPDRWYVVTRGPHTGRYGLWGHEGDGTEGAPFANLNELMTSIAEDLEESLGGVNRFLPEAASPPAPSQYEELFPLRYEPIE